ncbi:MAG: Na+/H+ antiporter NhaC family protein [Candidatus Sericytochromatia bacterium]|nr:Na+/H+ antiporter NhaC family protein [Candidatus Sericytochromatia bacterium]
MKRKQIFFSVLVLLGFVGLCLTLSATRADQPYLASQQFKVLFQDILGQAQAKYPDRVLQIDIQELPPDLRTEAVPLLKKWHESHPVPGQQFQSLQLRWQEMPHRERLLAKASSTAEPLQASRPRIHWTSALPPLVAVTLALLTRRLVLSLFMAILVGSVLAADWQLLRGSLEVFSRHGFAALNDFFHIQILLFAGFLMGMVGIMNVSGGTRGIVEALKRFISTRRSTKMMTCIMGLLVFFDDYANSFVIGTTMRPITDRMKISREKLAYLVDSTAAPVSGLAIISTWIGYEVGLFQQALDQLDDVTLGGYQAFIMALPFRFYCLLALIMVFLVVWLKRDFGPMYHAELRALNEGLVLRDGATPLTSKTFNGLEADPETPLRWYNAAVPVVSVILATLAGLYITGGGLKILRDDWTQLFSIQTLGTVFSSADNGTVLLWSSMLGCLVAAVMVLAQRLLNLRQLTVAWAKGVSSIGLASAILVLAWTLNNVSTEIGTAPYLISIFRDVVQPLWLPLLIFGLAGAIAFSTGSSWSTMAILIPVAVPLAYELGGPLLMLISMGAVLDGAIFGDHCSPLSDTTILSSIACSADHLDHVKTQFPYAVVIMLVAAAVCYFPASAGWSPYLLVPLGALALAGFLLLVGRNPEAAQRVPDSLPNHLRKPEPARYWSES